MVEAFDRVNHATLCMKLRQQCKLRGPVLGILESYLRHKQSHVAVGHACSRKVGVSKRSPTRWSAESAVVYHMHKRPPQEVTEDPSSLIVRR